MKQYIHQSASASEGPIPGELVALDLDPLCMVSTDADGILQTLDAAGSRALLGVEPAQTMFRDAGKSFSSVAFDGGWRSLLSASSARRKVAANSLSAGDVIEFEFFGMVNSGASGAYLEFTLSPSDFTTASSDCPVLGAYYLVLAGGNSPYAFTSGDVVIKTKIRLSCISIGATGALRITEETVMRGPNGEYYATENGVVSPGQITTTDTTVDNWIGLYADGFDHPSTFSGIFSEAKILKAVV